MSIYEDSLNSSSFPKRLDEIFLLRAFGIHLPEDIGIDVKKATIVKSTVESFMILFCHSVATHSSILAWKIPWTEETGGIQFMGLQWVRHDWVSAHACTHAHIQTQKANVYWVPTMLLKIFKALEIIKYLSLVSQRAEPKQSSSDLENLISKNRSKEGEVKTASVKMTWALYQASENYSSNCFSVLRKG